MQTCLPFLWRSLHLHPKPIDTTHTHFLHLAILFIPQDSTQSSHNMKATSKTVYKNAWQLPLLSVPEHCFLVFTLWIGMFCLNVLLVCLAGFGCAQCWVGVCHLPLLVETFFFSSKTASSLRSLPISFCTSSTCVNASYTIGSTHNGATWKDRNKLICRVKIKE